MSGMFHFSESEHAATVTLIAAEEVQALFGSPDYEDTFLTIGVEVGVAENGEFVRDFTTEGDTDRDVDFDLRPTALLDSEGQVLWIYNRLENKIYLVVEGAPEEFTKEYLMNIFIGTFAQATTFGGSVVPMREIGL